MLPKWQGFKKSKRTRELINRNEYNKRQIWKNKTTEKIHNEKTRKHEIMKADIIIKLKEIAELILRGWKRWTAKNSYK